MDAAVIKPFCILPFVHMKLGPSSIVQPRRMYEYFSYIGDTNNDTYNAMRQWKNFSDVRVYASIDAIEDKAEYIRHGSRWNTIMRNIREIKKNFAQMKDIINFTPTLSAHNAFDVLNLHGLIIEDFAIGDANIELYYLFTPRYLDIRILPYGIKKDIAEQYEEFINYSIEKEYVHLANNYKSAIQYIFSENKSEWFQDFKRFSKKLDIMRNESFGRTFPEFMKYKEFSDIVEGR